MAVHAPIMGAPTRATPYPLSPAERRQIEDHVEALIAMLDAADGDPDLEDDDPAGGAVDDRGEAPDYCEGEFSDPIVRRGHVRRLKRTRCYPVRLHSTPDGYVTHRLIEREARA